MAAPKGNKNASGNSGGKPSNDRELAAEVRSLTLLKIKALLEKEGDKMSMRELTLHDAILTKLAGTVLPRLNEVSGKDGEPIAVSWLSSPISPAIGQINSTTQQNAG